MKSRSLCAVTIFVATIPAALFAQAQAEETSVTSDSCRFDMAQKQAVFTSNVAVYTATGLTPGNHTIVVTKLSGTYTTLDGFNITSS